jgi:hypothetical protein
MPLELDLFLPEIRLAIEMQGPQHYGEVLHYGQDATNRLMENDKRKVSWCHNERIKLVWIDWRWFKTELSVMKSEKRIKYLSILLKDFMNSNDLFLHLPKFR